MEDSLAALQLARYARKSRAELRRRIAAGYVDPIEVLEYSHRLPDVFRIIRITDTPLTICVCRTF